MPPPADRAPAPLRLAAVLLTGGTARRLGGADKAQLDLDGVSLLERCLAALVAVSDVVVVGPRVPTSRPVTWTLEDPPGGGPAAGLLAGLDVVPPESDLVVALAVDMPRVSAVTLARLTWAVEADPAVDGALLADHAGRRQPLAAVYRRAALLEADPGGPRRHGLPVRRLLAGLRLAEVVGLGQESRDVDTWEDLAALRGSSPLI